MNIFLLNLRYLKYEKSLCRISWKEPGFEQEIMTIDCIQINILSLTSDDI